MNKLSIICGLLLLGGISTPKEKESKQLSCTEIETEYQGIHENNLVDNDRKDQEVANYSPELLLVLTAADPTELNLDEINFIEEEPDFDLGFDTADYLPEGFDPHEAYFDLNSIEYIEEKPEVELNFDPKDYLPVSFNPYSNVVNNIQAISFMEDETVELGFDTKEYLPKDFDPYTRVK